MVTGFHQIIAMCTGDNYLIMCIVTIAMNIGSADTLVQDGHQPPAPHLALQHVEQQAELTLLAAGVATAAPGHTEKIISCLQQQCHFFTQ